MIKIYICIKLILQNKRLCSYRVMTLSHITITHVIIIITIPKDKIKLSANDSKKNWSLDLGWMFQCLA